MKLSLKIIFLFALISGLFLTSCNSSDDDAVSQSDTQGLTLSKTITNTTHSIEIYSAKTTVETGYQKFYLRFKNLSTGNYENPSAVSWSPMMHMTSMQHACPYSTLSKSVNKTNLYEGYIVFTMPSNDTEYWDLTLNYTINGTQYTVVDKINVVNASKKNLVFAKDTSVTPNITYVVALIEPNTPKVAVNDMQVAVFKKESMMSWPIADGFTVKIDPRMPTMGNHSSPNNVNLTQSATGGFYNGKLSLTMTGYWKINLMVYMPSGTLIGGTEVTTTNEASTLYYEIEF